MKCTIPILQNSSDMTSDMTDVAIAIDALCTIGAVEELKSVMEKYNHGFTRKSWGCGSCHLDVIKLIIQTDPGLAEPIIEPTPAMVDVDEFLTRTMPQLYTDDVLARQFEYEVDRHMGDLYYKRNGAPSSILVY